MKTITLCGRPSCGGCPKLTIPVIKGTEYGPKDWFYLKDDFGNECKLNITHLQDLAKKVPKLQK
jgi:hypothetical protein